MGWEDDEDWEVVRPACSSLPPKEEIEEEREEEDGSELGSFPDRIQRELRQAASLPRHVVLRRGEDAIIRGRHSRPLVFLSLQWPPLGKVGFRPSVQDRRRDADRTEVGPRPVRPIFWDRRSRFGPVDRPSIGLWTSLIMCKIEIIQQARLASTLAENKNPKLLPLNFLLNLLQLL